MNMNSILESLSLFLDNAFVTICGVFAYCFRFIELIIGMIDSIFLTVQFIVQLNNHAVACMIQGFEIPVRYMSTCFNTVVTLITFISSLPKNFNSFLQKTIDWLSTWMKSIEASTIHQVSCKYNLGSQYTKDFTETVIETIIGYIAAMLSLPMLIYNGFIYILQCILSLPNSIITYTSSFLPVFYDISQKIIYSLIASLITVFTIMAKLVISFTECLGKLLQMYAFKPALEIVISITGNVAEVSIVFAEKIIIILKLLCSIPFHLSDWLYRYIGFFILSFMDNFSLKHLICLFIFLFILTICKLLMDIIAANNILKPNHKEAKVQIHPKPVSLSNQNEMQCVVCQDLKKSIVLLPCRHLCLCTECIRIYMEQQRQTHKCPLCRQKFLNHMVVYT